MRRTHIEIRGARTHNLRDVDADLPLGRITVVTGVSGSGKSSLAVDTLYAEGQRRFLTSLSAYARQFLDRLDRPDVDRLDYVPPAIAIGQTSRPTSARAYVGSMSGVSDLLQLLWGALGTPFCPRGHGPIDATSPSQIRARLAREHAGARALVVAPVPRARRTVAALTAEGYGRGLDAAGQVVELAELGPAVDPLPVLVDRLVVDDGPRIAEAVAAAFALSGGRAAVRVLPREGAPLDIPFVARPACAVCDFEVPPRESRLFNPSSPLGACRACQGFGRIQTLDLDRVVPDASRSLLRDAIAPWSTPGYAEWKEPYARLARRHGIDLTQPWRELPEAHRALVLEGDPSLDFPGVRGFFAHLETKRYKIGARILIARYRDFVRCPECGGAKLQPGALAYRVDGRTLGEAHALDLEATHAWIAALETRPDLDPAVRPLARRIAERLAILERIGLGYLTLDREGRTLSSGEARRLHLSSALGAGVTGTLYVLDEPSIGLHPRDTTRLGELLAALSATGNTVVVVEHDAELIARADHVIELGPAAGKRGGRTIFAGTPAELAELDTPTARTLRARPDAPVTPLPTHAGLRGQTLTLRGVRARHLAGFDVHLPLGALTCITGVSGSGKSTLAEEVLAKNLPRALAGAPVDPAQLAGIIGHGPISELHVVDTSPLARSARSIPATYIGAWDPIRKVIAKSADARRLGLADTDFSFNSGGRCDACQGLGTVTVDMQFLEDVTMVCEQCGGKRFGERVLGARWHGRTAAEILELTVDEAWDAFSEERVVRRRLEPLREVGLGYLQLGQSTSTLSGGEAQRLKLAAHLADKAKGHPLIVLDEPTTGLHHTDVVQLLSAFAALLERGATLVVVEHHLEVIRHAHHLVDLGPEGGARGGRLVAQGSVAAVRQVLESYTGAALSGTRTGPAAGGAGPDPSIRAT